MGFPNFTAPNLSAATTAATSLSNLVLAIPQIVNSFRTGPAYTQGYVPQNQPTPTGLLASIGTFLQPQPGFLFNFEGENKVVLKSDITDHFIEDNTAIQDQCALHPEMIHTQGFIAELNNIAPPGLNTLQSLVNRLVGIEAYAPELTLSALNAYNAAFQAYQIGANVVNSGAAAWSSIAGNGGEGVINGLVDQNGNAVTQQANQNKQQTAFQKFYGWWRNRTFFTVQTPWAVFQSCLIDELTAVQSEETNVISEFKVTFKLIRKAQSTSVILPAVRQGQNATQAASLTNNGTQTPLASTPLSQLGANFSLPGAP